MPHSNFEERSHTSNSGVGKCSCGQTFNFASEKEIHMKFCLHRKFCSNPPKGFNKIRMPNKAMMLKEHQNNETERMRKVHELN